MNDWVCGRDIQLLYSVKLNQQTKVEGSTCAKPHQATKFIKSANILAHFCNFLIRNNISTLSWLLGAQVWATSVDWCQNGSQNGSAGKARKRVITVWYMVTRKMSEHLLQLNFFLSEGFVTLDMPNCPQATNEATSTRPCSLCTLTNSFRWISHHWTSCSTCLALLSISH